MSRFKFLCLLLLALSGCAPYDAPRAYKDLESLKRSNDFSASVSLGAMPSDAGDIEVYSDIDSGLVLISYKTSEGVFVSKGFGRQLSAGLYRLVQENLGFVDVTISDIRYACESREVKAGGELLKYQQVAFLGQSSGRQYRWNSVNPDVYRKLCLDPAVGV